MGHTKQHAIIVTSWDWDALNEAYLKAVATFGKMVTDYAVSDVNARRTFLICPDGHSETHEESETFDQMRFEYIAYLEKFCYDGGSSPLDWVELYYGCEVTGTANILNHN